MWPWTSSALLAALVVSGLSFPNPDEKEYKIPEVGTGQRSQYYVLHSDGTFKYGFDDGEGGFESVKSHTVGNREGKFGYVDQDGNTIRLEYEAGEGGFVARGDHLPKPSPELAQALATVIRSNRPFVDPLASSDSDASYGFKFESSDHTRSEQSDADGTVTGSYSYIDEDLVKRSFRYRAGKGIGFVIEGDGLTQDLRTPEARTNQETRNQQDPGVRTRHRTSYSPAQGLQVPLRASEGRRRTYSSDSFTDHQTPVASSRSNIPGDASYSFSYDAGDHSRSETADPNLNIDGKFTFVADDGREREVTYEAGSSTGFRAEGDHLPKAPEPSFGERLSSSPQQRKTYSRHSSANVRRTENEGAQLSSQYDDSARGRGYTYQTRTGISHDQPASIRTSGTSYRQRESQRRQFASPRKSEPSYQSDKTPSPSLRTSAPSRVREHSNTRSSLTPKGYSFSYETSDHSRSEKGDEANNVEGEFAFRAPDDGQVRQIKYEAGSDTGFIAEGDHIPVGPPVPGAPSGQPTGRIVPVPSVRFFDPLADSDSDASYKFGFDSETYSRSESADEDGNVVGTYTIVDEDGVRVTYRFRAGKGIGYEQQEISRVQGPRPIPPVRYRGPLAGDISEAAQGHTVRRGSQGLLTPSTSLSTRQDQSFAQRTPHFRESEAASYVSPAQPSFKHSQGATRAGSRSSFSPFDVKSSSSSSQVFPGFVLHRYDQTPNSEKFGYVLKYDK